MSTDAAGLKQQAAWYAVALVQPGMVVGLGAGSTAALAVERIGELLRAGELRGIVGVACSLQGEGLARRWGIPLVSLNERPAVDLTVDGADEVDHHLDLIKGGGGALLREKMVAQASRREVIVVDESKLSPVLGTRFALPVEVVPFGWEAQVAFLASLGAVAARRHARDGTPFVTDQGNFILDCRTGPMTEPAEWAARLNERAGIVEHGLFLGLASDVVVATPQGIRHLRRGNAR
jgi:ribose 5-phosphate isomerase A